MRRDDTPLKSQLPINPQTATDTTPGAGAAGASAAYHLRKYALAESLAINITIFEKTDRVGGRTLTVNPLDDAASATELGASIFVDANRIMYDAARNFGLDLGGLREEGGAPDDYTAIWDGDSFLFVTSDGASWWWDAAKLWWRYGTSPYYAVKLVKRVVGQFLQLYEEPYFPFRSLTQRVFELGLHKITAVTGEQFLADNKVSLTLSRDVSVCILTCLDQCRLLPRYHPGGYEGQLCVQLGVYPRAGGHGESLRSPH